MNAIYRLRGVKQHYNGRTVLDVPELDIPARSITGVVGPNGSGKTTLIHLLAFLAEPAEGSVEFGDDAQRKNGQLRRDITLLTQEPYLLKRTVLDNVTYGLKVRGVHSRSERQERAEDALKSVGLAPETFLKRQWYELSGGEAQRVALAARLILRPQVLLMDEPTASLDEESAQRILQASMEARRKWDATLVIISHDRNWIDSVCDNLVILRQGRLSESRYESTALAPAAE